MASPSVFHVVLAGAGLVLVWSGIHGANLTVTVKELLAGRIPPYPGEPVIKSIGGGGDPGAGGRVPDPGATPTTDGSSGGTGAAANKANARLQAAPYGWSTGAQWAALDKLWTQESDWDSNSQNPTSTAYGIAQFLDGTWAGVGGTKTSDPTLQIRYGLKYIKQRYGDPVRAWAHEVAMGWY